MKRVLFILAGLLVAGTVLAQSPGNDKKAARAALKIEKEAAVGRQIDSLILIENFQFVPTEVDRRNGSRISIRKYEYTKILPGRLYADMTGTVFDGFFRGTTPYNKCERKGNKWFITIQMDYHTGTMTFDFVINRKNGDTVLKVSTNRGLPLIYTGRIEAN